MTFVQEDEGPAEAPPGAEEEEEEEEEEEAEGERKAYSHGKLEVRVKGAAVIRLGCLVKILAMIVNYEGRMSKNEN